MSSLKALTAAILLSILLSFIVIFPQHLFAFDRGVKISENNVNTQAQTVPASQTKSPTIQQDAGFKVKGKYYALIIGINKYKTIPALQTAVFDAKEIAKILETNYGFSTQVLLDKDATNDNISHAINEYRKTLTPDDKLLIYYAGHGYYDESTATSYWLPVDAEKDDDTNWLMSKKLTSNLKRIASRHVLIIADSCYSGTLTRSAVVSLSTSENRKTYLEKLLTKPARILISSGGNEPVTDAGGSGHSIFADALIKALKSMDQEMFTAEELFASRIKESVAGRAEQTPEYQIIRDSGHDGGDFIFVSSIKKYGTTNTVENVRSDNGRLLVSTDPAGASCYINDKLMGNTPIDQNLPSGTYDIRLEKNGYNIFNEKVLIQGDKTLAVNRVMVNSSGSLLVKTVPDGTMVYVDGVFFGEAPQKIASIKAGSHMIELKRDGYKTWTDSVNIISGESLSIKAELTKIEVSTPSTPTPNNRVNRRINQDSEKKSSEHVAGPLPSF